MTIINTLSARSNNQCELCNCSENLSVYEVPPVEANADKCIFACEACKSQLSGDAEVDVNHWRCLSESMWSTVPAVQVVAYRQLQSLSSEPWAQDSLDMLYLEDDVKEWALSTMEDEDATPTLDSNGTVLQAGDNVTIIKDLQVKGAGFTAKRGTAVRNISLTNNPEHIEGRVNGTRVVLVSAFLKKM
ncbi:MAG: PhnA domain-containing protein [Gammaproteobacteria bacterium]|nr:PhnA domain-containing protein [Gammaproteobacteria bacterium]